jgi:hypothetical protein
MDFALMTTRIVAPWQVSHAKDCVFVIAKHIGHFGRAFKATVDLVDELDPACEVDAPKLLR